MITYNHAPFIAQAIEGVLMQQVNFPFELVIGEDCSTDDTRSICVSYQQRYPEIIKLRIPEHNLGMVANGKENHKACAGKYIAICEGDDYWTDPLKLQKQVDFLENHPDYSLCCHKFIILDEHKKEYFPANTEHVVNDRVDGFTFDNSLNLKKWLTQGLTLVIRKGMLDLSIYDRYQYINEEHFCYYLLKAGKGYFLNFTGAVYRIHDGGVYSKKTIEFKSRMHYLLTNALASVHRTDKCLKEKRKKNRNTFLFLIGRRFFRSPFSPELRGDIRCLIVTEYKYGRLGACLALLKTLLVMGGAYTEKKVKTWLGRDKQ